MCYVGSSLGLGEEGKACVWLWIRWNGSDTNSTLVTSSSSSGFLLIHPSPVFLFWLFHEGGWCVSTKFPVLFPPKKHNCAVVGQNWGLKRNKTQQWGKMSSAINLATATWRRSLNFGLDSVFFFYFASGLLGEGLKKVELCLLVQLEWMNGKLLQHWSNHHEGLGLTKGSVPILCLPSGAFSGSVPAAEAQGSGLAASLICCRCSHSHHKLWMDTGNLMLSAPTRTNPLY